MMRAIFAARATTTEGLGRARRRDHDHMQTSAATRALALMPNTRNAREPVRRFIVLNLNCELSIIRCNSIIKYSASLRSLG
jgi:hypothetical protein